MTMNQEELLSNIPEKLQSIKYSKNDLPPIIIEFSNYLASISNEEHTPVGLFGQFLLAYEDVLDEYSDGKAKNMMVPFKLKKRAAILKDNIMFFPLVIDEISDIDFAVKFRQIYHRYFLKRPIPSANLKINELYYTRLLKISEQKFKYKNYSRKNSNQIILLLLSTVLYSVE